MSYFDVPNRSPHSSTPAAVSLYDFQHLATRLLDLAA